MIKSRWILLSVAAALTALLVACGGDSDGDADTAAAAGSPAGAEVVEDGTLNVADVAASLEAIESFRFDLSLEMDFEIADGGSSEDAAAAAMLAALLGNIKAEGAFVAPDSFQAGFTFFGMDVQTIQIGEEAWTNDGSGWVADSGDLTFSLPFDMSSPADLPFEFLPMAELAGAKVSSENVNGVNATRYSFDKEALAALADAAGESAGLGDLSEVDTMTLDIWLNGDSVPVRMVMDIQGQSEGSEIAVKLEFNLTDINDSGITIERPI